MQGITVEIPGAIILFNSHYGKSTQTPLKDTFRVLNQRLSFIRAVTPPLNRTNFGAARIHCRQLWNGGGKAGL